jgi:hypothetical protein
LGHRVSIDIDLFTDKPYDSIDFKKIDQLMKNIFQQVEIGNGGNNSMGQTYYVGNSGIEMLKIDLFYTDAFVFPLVNRNGIRLATVEEITAMKLEVVTQGGRKKIFGIYTKFEITSHFPK